jgi:hemerythrin superfamily protein
VSAIDNNNFYENKQREMLKDLYEELIRSKKSIFDRKTGVNLFENIVPAKNNSEEKKIFPESKILTKDLV